MTRESNGLTSLSWRQRIRRWYFGAILCFFAFVPGWILFKGLIDAFGNPPPVAQLTWADVFGGLGVITVCAALLYFLLLLAYRAFTGQGRKQDGGLLPPWAMQGFAVAFALAGAAVSAMGIKQQDMLPVLAGLVEFLIGLGVFRIAGARRRAAKGADRPS